MKDTHFNWLNSIGTTKRKELHGTTSAQALSGTWALQTDDITLHAYHLNFSCDIETYNDFVLLTEAKLDDEIAGAKMDLYLIPNKLVKTSVSPFGQVHLKSEQVCAGYFSRNFRFEIFLKICCILSRNFRFEIFLKIPRIP